MNYEPFLVICRAVERSLKDVNSSRIISQSWITQESRENLTKTTLLELRLTLTQIQHNTVLHCCVPITLVRNRGQTSMTSRHNNDTKTEAKFSVFTLPTLRSRKTQIRRPVERNTYARAFVVFPFKAKMDPLKSILSRAFAELHGFNGRKCGQILN